MAKLDVFVGKSPKGREGSNLIQKKLLQNFCILNSIFWSQIMKQISEKGGGVSKNPKKNYC